MLLVTLPFKHVLSLTAAASLFLIASHSHAAGMVPETSLLLIDEAVNGGSINIKNTDTRPALLYTTVVDLPDDKGTRLLVTQPVVRVEGGQTQQLRFILQSDTPLTTEHMKRVVFEGIPQKQAEKNKLTINIRQDLPVLIRPASLPEVKDAWTLLSWSRSGGQVMVKNSSPYVVRLAPQVELLPSRTQGKLSKNYLLPGQTLTVVMEKAIGNDTQVKFLPASRYGVQVSAYTAPLH
ncbi:fimbria/pilus chaperone family protein [Enterobacter ludwigii]